ncbi:hypothetical protein [Streptomyces sp. NPDC001404]|uniref:hypothetical protein n=1 Tax=Streptomyces sp. NPDC001404 TaxID=3364571 RepID=UPI0036C52C11
MPDATLQLRSLKGLWRRLYARRLALHATVEAVVLAAWRDDLPGLDLAPAVAAWRPVTEESADPWDQHRRESAAAAVLAILRARLWPRTRGALALAVQQAHRLGWAAGHQLVSGESGDDGDLDDASPQRLGLGSPTMAEAAVDVTVASALGAALGASARRAGRAMADSTDAPQYDAQEALAEGLDLTLAADAAVSAAYGAGLLAAYLGAGTGSVVWLTAGDGRVCERCAAAEAGSPYSLLAAPRLPQHPRCRCVLAPA